jgi:hypothetical protein
MHLHSIQPNPYAQLDALRSAQRAAARREAAQVRKELVESASELEADSDFSDLAVMQAEDEKQSQRQPKRGSKRNTQDRQDESRPEPKDSENSGARISDWA